MFQATRRRLALWYTAVTAVLLLLFASGVYLYVRSTLIDRIDDTLKHVVEVVERSLILQPASGDRYIVNTEASFGNRVTTDAVEEDHIDLEWFNQNGELVWSTFAEPLRVPLYPHPHAKTVYLSEAHWLRQITQQVDFGDYTIGYLRVSHPWFEVTKPIRQLVLDLAIGISLMLLIVAGVGWLLSGIAIQPVKDSYWSLKQFTADASHELRNPIAMIQTNVQMALAYSDAESPSSLRQLKVIERLTERLGGLVNDLLFLARSDSGMTKVDYQPVPLDALLIEVIEEQRARSQQQGVSLCLKIPEPQTPVRQTSEDLFTIRGDWDQLARLFTNLVSNGIEYTHPKVDQPDSTASVEVELNYLYHPRQPKLQVVVKDTGIGIPSGDLPHIFDRFYRADPSRNHQTKLSSGTGLGLAIAKAIVENHQGTIEIESQLNQGTSFTLIFPAIISGA